MATSILDLYHATTRRISLAFLVATAVPAQAMDCRSPTLSVPCVSAPARLAKGTLLVASHELLDPNFHETVVLIADYGPDGASGLILNRPSRATLAEILPGEESLRPRNDTIYIGGPVAQDRLILLIRSKDKPPDSLPLFDDVYISGSASTLRQLTAPSGEAVFRSYMGYAGWGPGQLEEEVERGDWRILPAEAEMIFEHSSRSLWRTLIERSSGAWTMLERRSTPTGPRGSDEESGFGREHFGRLAPARAGGQKGPEERSA